MKKTSPESNSSKVAMAVGSVGGAAAGIAAGMAAASSTASAGTVSNNAAHRPDTSDLTSSETELNNTSNTSDTMSNSSLKSKSSSDDLYLNNESKASEAPAASDNDINLNPQVQAYGRMADAQGNEMDVIVLDSDGQKFVVADSDLDGVADVMISDLDGDGRITENEVIDVSDENVAMADILIAEEPEEPQVEVMAYGRMSDAQGNQSDVVVLNADGNQAVVVDHDLDGVADVVMADYNGDGQITDDEIINVTDDNVLMADLVNPQPEPESPELLAHGTLTDAQGNTVNVAVMQQDGMQIVAADVDNDGVIDMVVADANGDGQISEDEVADVRDMNVLMADITGTPAAPVEDPVTAPDMELLAFERVEDEKGNQMDMAAVSVGGEHALLVDADLDGQADVLIADLNGDGQITEDELVDLAQNGIDIAMPDADSDMLLADNSMDDDYINNADVDDYMA